MVASGGAGRFAPSPSGDLHLGNFRTAVLAWAFARASGREFYLRIEDIDSQRSRAEAAAGQIGDLAALGLDWDGDIVYQSHHFGLYERALEYLQAQGLVYECYCSRADIRAAASAPNGGPGGGADAGDAGHDGGGEAAGAGGLAGGGAIVGAIPGGFYPGTCRNLTEAQRQERRAALEVQGRAPALRFGAPAGAIAQVDDTFLGPYEALVDNFVLRRSDGDWAYNLAVVVDDLAAGVDQVVRADDLASSAPAQVYLAAVLRNLLGGQVPSYAHVPLVLGPTGRRLAKRDGAVTRAQLHEQGLDDADICAWILHSLGAPVAKTNPRQMLGQFLAGFDPQALPREPYRWQPEAL